MLLSCNRKSLGTEDCLPTSAVDAAFAASATCQITVLKMQLLTRTKAYKHLAVPFCAPLKTGCTSLGPLCGLAEVEHTVTSHVKGT